MSTKRLESSLFQYGKSAAVKIATKQNRCAQRARNKIALKKICQAPNLADALYFSPPDDSGCWRWMDKKNMDLRVIDRMIAKKVGQPWQDVRNQITQQCKHINYRIWRSIKNHLDWIEEYPEGNYKFVIDNKGILQRYKAINGKSNKTLTSSLTYEQHQLKKKFLNWLDGRKIDKVGSKYFWMVYVEYRSDFGYQDKLEGPRYRQDRQLTKKEVTFLKTIITSLRKDWYTNYIHER